MSVMFFFCWCWFGFKRSSQSWVQWPHTLKLDFFNMSILHIASFSKLYPFCLHPVCYFFLQSNTTWIPSQSPIVIDRQLVVRSSSTLVVQAGVSIIFTASDATFDVYGESCFAESLQDIAYSLLTVLQIQVNTRIGSDSIFDVVLTLTTDLNNIQYIYTQCCPTKFTGL